MGEGVEGAVRVLRVGVCDDAGEPVGLGGKGEHVEGKAVDAEEASGVKVVERRKDIPRLGSVGGADIIGAEDIGRDASVEGDGVVPPSAKEVCEVTTRSLI